jgi:hypothetical protein
MVAPGFLSDPEVRQWLNGLEPAWTMLGFDSFNALHEEPSATNRAIRLEANLNKSDLSGSTVARTARMLLERASETGGLKLTASGNLARGVDAGGPTATWDRQRADKRRFVGENFNRAFQPSC